MSEDQPSNRQPPPHAPSSFRGKQPILPPLRPNSSLTSIKQPFTPSFDYHRFSAVDDVNRTVTTADQEDDVVIVQPPPVKRKFGTENNNPAPQAPCSSSGLPSLRTYPRSECSLGVLANTFINLLMGAEDGILDLNNAAATMKVKKRRLYDITNVLEGVGLIEKVSKNRIRWKGEDASKPEVMKDDVTQLKAEIESLSVKENALDESIREMQEKIRNLTEDDKNQKLLFVTEDGIKSVPHFQNETLIAIKAPHGTVLEVPDPDETGDHPQRRYRIILRSTMGPIDVYLVSQYEDKFEDMPIASNSGSNDNPATSVADTGMEANAEAQHVHTMASEPNIPQNSSGGITNIVNDDASDYWLFSDIEAPLTDMWDIDLDGIDWDGDDLQYGLGDTNVNIPDLNESPSDAPAPS